MITAKQLRQQYLDFFRSNGHAIIRSASLIPDNDPTVLFTTAGMHPLVPYLLGAKHPQGTRLADVQKCVRTGDIDDVGDATHCTFFEMLGNWSLGDYFKKESIDFSYRFLTEVLGIDPARIAVSVFAGDEDAPRDEFSADCWASHGIARDRIFYLPKKNNWWGPAGITGPCGPDTEIFIIRDVPACSETCSPACDCGKYVEIWNNVFMEYDKQADGSFLPLAQKNVDTGMGLERTVAMLNGFESVYETDVFRPVMELLDQKAADVPDRLKGMRVIADHIRTATFMLGDEKGVTPSNVDQGYILRRLIRRALRFARTLELDPAVLTECARIYIDLYKEPYPELGENSARILDELEKEITRFSATLQQGLKEFDKLLKYIQNNRMSGKAAFKLYDTYGFPIEMTLELARDNGITVDEAGYEACFKEHQQKSQAGAEQKFKGGLADHTEQTARLHTATHLLLASLKKVLGDEGIQQKGSNITAERLRFDFNFPRALTPDELKAVEAAVNEAIAAGVEIVCEEMPIEQARAQGATGVFDSKYQDVVKVYTMGGFSKEICGGPHAANTAELGKFKIVKEQSSSSGVRRIKGVIEG
ncbi:MAG TPA: alanine--tRNA ligase [Candidatus Stercoripulliclostridium merdipullorum]|uniref:Alanine--tRNA ligase n=1 Tax=Candidatus Stercoripulliclostridium merdipullorum TaxID=2840952 RepID=A0A9D1SX69_9FIRM|nr:alanine--tRNA ligase [Candidatus Stercoripulliclostridium merdipullorum]